MYKSIIKNYNYYKNYYEKILKIITEKYGMCLSKISCYLTDLELISLDHTALSRMEHLPSEKCLGLCENARTGAN